MARDFLFELLCEELPPKSLLTLSKALATGVSEALNKAGLHFAQSIYHASPRRLALVIKQLDEETGAETIERLGPSVKHAFDDSGNPTKAALGFAKGLKVEVSDLSRHKTDKGEWLSFHINKPPQKTIELLPAFVEKALQALPIPKPMHWGELKTLFVRPVHNALMLFGEEVVPGSVLGLNTTNETKGHRFHAPETIAIKHADDYVESLRKAYVLVDNAERQRTIKSQCENKAASIEANVHLDEDLLNEVSALVEWPHALVVPFDKRFLDVPREVLVTSMAEHQKCFALSGKDGELLPSFITVSNIDSTNEAQVIAGNEKVMRARLSDAEFFFSKDKETTLASKAEKLSAMLFQKKLGSLQDKVDRVAVIARSLARPLAVNEDLVTRAVQLAKADLVSLMVFEFPALEGEMGAEYAKFDGEEESVCLAIKEQYLPRFSGDLLPQSDMGLILSLADRIDTLVGIFAIGEKPSGVKDPFKCRRHALAIVRLLLEAPATIGLDTLIADSVSAYEGLLDATKAEGDVKTFILERLKGYFLQQDVTFDVFEAVLAVESSDLQEMKRRIDALTTFRQSEHAADLAAAFKRIGKLLDKASLSGEARVDASLFSEAAESSLHKRLLALDETIQPLLAANEYGKVLTTLSELKPEVDAFFETVMVMAEDEKVKQNRLHLLFYCQQLFFKVADIAKLEA